jgi:HEXXH motif-containing protein
LIELLATLAYELSATGRPSAKLSLERLPRRILALAARRGVDIPGEATGATFSGGSFRLHGRDASLRTPYVVLDDPLLLALEDNNPLAMTEAHPAKSGNALDLGGQSVEAWVTSLRGALDLLRELVPELRAEMDACALLVVPVGYDAEKHLSASYAEVPGTVYLSLHPDPVTMAEALLHELSHTKINLLSEHDRVLENAFEPLFPSPVRPDPRPLWGVLLAVHAFLPVELLYRRLLESGHALARTPRFRARAAEIRRTNEEGLAVLTEHARPTRVGEGLVAELARWGERFRAGS